MKVDLQSIGKKFRRNWIFRDISYEFNQGGRYAILGSNGSGKSTLLQIISGLMMPSEGEVHYFSSNKEINVEDVYKDQILAAPYMELFEQLTLKEHLEMHTHFRRIYDAKGIIELLEIFGLEKHANKKIADFSSGMRQRLKLGMALLTESSLLLLDEPLSNLDDAGKKWYREMVDQYSGNRTVIVCSNHLEAEYEFCAHTLTL